MRDRVINSTSGQGAVLPGLDGLKEKFISKGIDVGLLEKGDIVGWEVLSKDIKSFAGYITLEVNRDIMFAGPARTYEETEVLINDLFFYDMLHERR